MRAIDQPVRSAASSHGARSRVARHDAPHGLAHRTRERVAPVDLLLLEEAAARERVLAKHALAERVDRRDRRSVEGVQRARELRLCRVVERPEVPVARSAPRPAPLLGPACSSSSLPRTRTRSSLVAFSVNVTTRMRSMGTSPASTSSTTRCSSVKVLPVPAEASSDGVPVERHAPEHGGTGDATRAHGASAGWRPEDAEAPLDHLPRRRLLGEGVLLRARDRTVGRPQRRRPVASAHPVARLLEHRNDAARSGPRAAVHEDRLAREEVRVRLAEQLAHAVAQPAPAPRPATAAEGPARRPRASPASRRRGATRARGRRATPDAARTAWSTRARSIARFRPAWAHSSVGLVRALRERDRGRLAGPERQRAPRDLRAHDPLHCRPRRPRPPRATSASCTRIGARVLTRAPEAVKLDRVVGGRRSPRATSPSVRARAGGRRVRRSRRRPTARGPAARDRARPRRTPASIRSARRGRVEEDLAQEQRLVAELGLERLALARERRRRPRPRRGPGGTGPTPGAGARGTSRARASGRPRAHRSTARPVAVARGTGGAGARPTRSRPAPRGRRRRGPRRARAVSLEASAKGERPRLGARLREHHRAERARLAAEDVREVALVPSAQRMPAPQRSPRRPRSPAAMAWSSSCTTDEGASASPVSGSRDTYERTRRSRAPRRSSRNA